MSQAIPKSLSTVLVVDPICDFSSEAIYAVEKSVSNSYYYSLNANSSTPISTNFTINVNDLTTITNRLFLLDQTFTIRVPTGNDQYIKDCKFALRSWPLMKFATNYILTLGNGTSTINIGAMANVIERFGLMDKWLNYSTTPLFGDVVAPYSSVAGNVNPLESFSQTTGEIMYPRGSYAPVSVVGSGAAPNYFTDITYRVVEPLFISPLLQSMGLKDRREGLTHLSQIQLQIQWANVNRLFSCDTNISGANPISVYFGIQNDAGSSNNESSIIRVVQYVPSVLDIGRNIETQTLPYNEVVVFSDKSQPLSLRPTTADKPKGPGMQFVSSVLQLSRVPKEIYVWVCPSNSVYATNGGDDSGYMVPDTFATYVDNTLQVVWNGQNLLSNISAANLYNLQVMNGINIPFTSWNSNLLVNKLFTGAQNKPVPEFASGIGSPICLKMGRDIVLGVDLAPGVNTRVNLQVSGNWFCPIAKTADTPFNHDSISYTMNVAVVYEGAWEFFGSNTTAQTVGCLTTQDVLEATKRNERVHYDIVSDSAFGGSLFSRAMSFFKEGKHKPYIEKFKRFTQHPLYQEASKVAKSHLRGTKKMAEGYEGPEEQGQSHIADLADSLGLGRGGAKMSKAQLKKMLMG